MNAALPTSLQRLTLAEIAEALGVSKQATAKRAEKESWPFEEQAVRGGKKRHFSLTDLPSDVRQAIQKHAMAKALPVIAQEISAPIVFSSPAYLVTDKQRLERDARSGVIAALNRLQDQSKCSQEAALTTLLTNARAGKLDEYTNKILRQARDPRGRAGDGYPSVRTLKRWLGSGDLTPKVQQKDMRVPAWAKDFLSQYQVPQKPSVEEAHRDFVTLWPGVSVHQVRRFLAKLGEVTRERGRMGTRELKNIRPFIRRDWSDFQPNDAWIADGHTFDAEVQHPFHGRPFRPEITVFIDGGTRRVTGWSISLAENSISVADALATGVRLCGLPAIVYGDNGAGYRANLLTDEATGILARIHASPEFALPYNSQGKGIIERLHRTLWVPAAKELPSYVGVCMDKEARLAQFKLTRKALKHGGSMPLIPHDVFVNFIAEKVSIYNARPHRSLGGVSPDGAWASWMARGWQAERLTEIELVDFFRPRIERTVARGEINLFTNIYYSRQLEEFHGMALHVAYDIRDPAKVWIYAPDGRFICDADVNGNKRAAFPVAVQQQAREKRAKGRLQRIDVKRTEILEEMHGGPALVAPSSAQIVIGGRILDRAALHTTEQVTHEKTIAMHEEPPVMNKSEQAANFRQSRTARSAAENYAEWREIDNRIFAGEFVDEQDARWHRSYQQSAQFRAEAKRKAAA
ncbi:MAG: Mu transposase C-terminal domain-containing protein [Betaproteobacteria bacterium]